MDPIGQVSFAPRVTATFKQSKCVSPNAMVMGDIDADTPGEFELAVGGMGGELALYKYSKTVPWQLCSDLGSITCLALGDLRGQRRNSLLALTGEGDCFVFDVRAPPPAPAPEARAAPQGQRSILRPRYSAGTSKHVHFAAVPTRPTEWFTETLQPSSVHRIIHNANCALITDYDEDGVPELLVGTSNREVYAYSLRVPAPPGAAPSPGGASGGHSQPQQSAALARDGALVMKAKWRVNHKVHSLACGVSEWGRTLVLVGMTHDDTYAVIDHAGALHECSLDSVHAHRAFPRGGPVEVRHVARAPVSPSGRPRTPALRALVTLSGGVALLDGAELLWARGLGEQLYGAHTVEVGGEQLLVLSSWQGRTFLFTTSGRVVVFPPDERVQAFTAGHFTLAPHVPAVPTLAYTTFNDEVLLYPGLCQGAVAAALRAPPRLPPSRRSLSQLAADVAALEPH